jgi:hypothetical protein
MSSRRGPLTSLDGILLADGLDAALVGVGSRCSKPDVAVYDVEQVVEILMRRDGMTEEEAWEFFGFNIEGAWVGEQTPVWVRRPDDD